MSWRAVTASPCSKICARIRNWSSDRNSGSTEGIGVLITEIYISEKGIASHRSVVACLGDSITEGSPYWDSRKRTGNPEGQWEHWAGRLHPELELRNFGIWGERTDEIATRFDEAVAGADVLIVQGGINDIAQGRPTDAAAHNLAALVEGGLALDLRVAVCDVLPWNNGWPEKAAAIRELNERIHGFGVPLLPFHDTLEDPDHPGRMKDEWTHDDGDHPSLAGYRRLGELAFRLPEA